MKRALLPLALSLQLFSLLTIHSPGQETQAQDKADQSSETVYDLRGRRPDGITNPKPTYTPGPEYTDRARKKKISGTVIVSFVVNTDGDVRDPQVTTSLDQDLDQQAIKAASKWKFAPATKNGTPVAVRIQAEMSFNIR